jgi:hypothetical protein
MSDGDQEIERIRHARRILERMSGRMLRPTLESMAWGAKDLELAVDCLYQLDVSFKSAIWQMPDRRRLEREVMALRHAVRSVEQLLKNAGKFYAGLARLMAPDEAPSNYTANGTNQPTAHAAVGSVVVHG